MNPGDRDIFAGVVFNLVRVTVCYASRISKGAEMVKAGVGMDGMDGWRGYCWGWGMGVEMDWDCLSDSCF